MLKGASGKLPEVGLSRLGGRQGHGDTPDGFPPGHPDMPSPCSKWFHPACDAAAAPQRCRRGVAGARDVVGFNGHLGEPLPDEPAAEGEIAVEAPRQIHKAPRHDAGCFRVAIAACGDRLDWEHALRLLEEMRSCGIEPNAATYRAAARVCSQCRQWHHALQLEEMAGAAPPPPLVRQRHMSHLAEEKRMLLVRPTPAVPVADEGGASVKNSREVLIGYTKTLMTASVTRETEALAQTLQRQLPGVLALELRVTASSSSSRSRASLAGRLAARAQELEVEASRLAEQQSHQQVAAVLERGSPIAFGDALGPLHLLAGHLTRTLECWWPSAPSRALADNLTRGLEEDVGFTALMKEALVAGPFSEEAAVKNIPRPVAPLVEHALREQIRPRAREEAARCRTSVRDAYSSVLALAVHSGFDEVPMPPDSAWLHQACRGHLTSALYSRSSTLLPELRAAARDGACDRVARHTGASQGGSPVVLCRRLARKLLPAVGPLCEEIEGLWGEVEATRGLLAALHRGRGKPHEGSERS